MSNPLVTLDREYIRQHGPSVAEVARRTQVYFARPKIIPFDRLPMARATSGKWQDNQAIAPRYAKRIDWRDRLVRTFDRWSVRTYATGEYGCFLFACDCLDAMLGSDFFDCHFRSWHEPSDFWPYLRAVGGLDFFDIAGSRSSPDAVLPGDLIQIEHPVNGRLNLHWAIAADQPGRSVTFTVGGIFEDIIPVRMLGNQAIKVWRLHDPLNPSVGGRGNG